MKHHGGCIPTQERDGDFRWEFPSGREYRTEPPSRVTFRTVLEDPGAQSLDKEYTREHPFGIDEWDDPGNEGKPKGNKPDSKPGHDEDLPF